MGILECSKHKSVASFFTSSAVGEAWTFRNFFTSFGDPHGDNNSDGKIQSTYKNSLIQVQKSCKNECFTQRQRDWALQHLQFFDTKAGKQQRKNTIRDEQPRNNQPRGNQPQGIEIKHIGQGNFNWGRDGIRVEVSRQSGLEVREQGRKRKSLSASVSDSEKSETERDIDSTGTYKNGEDVLSDADEDALMENEHDVFEPLSKKEIEEHSFWKAYKAIDNGSKRKLHCSGKLVEDVIRAFVNPSKDISQPLNSLTGLWVVNFTAREGPDAALLKKFTNDEYTELAKESVFPPALSSNWEHIYSKLNEPQDLALNARFVELLQGNLWPGNISLLDRDWIQICLMNWRSLCKIGQLNGVYTEQCWSSILWAPTFDFALRSTGMMLQRGESTTKSSTVRRNKDHTPTTKKRKRVGSKVDGQLKGNITYELLTIESVKPLQYSFYGNKFDADFHKMVRDMHDMLNSIHQDFGSELASELGVRTIGILEQGPQWSVYSLKLEGSTSYSRRHFKRSVPTIRDDIDAFLDIMRFITRIQGWLNDMRKKLQRTDLDSVRNKKVSIFDFQSSSKPAKAK